MKRLLIVFVSFICNIYAYNFNLNNVKEIRGSNNSYFGYALVLQRGAEPIVIVGAPRQLSEAHGGSVYACTLEGRCTKYNISASSMYSFNGNFLGSALDGSENVGEQFVVCAPRLVSAVSNDNYLKGLCFLKENSSSYAEPNSVIKPLEKEVSINNYGRTSYYDNAFGEAGIDIHYLKDANEVLLGAPGIKSWNGAIIIQSLPRLNEYQIIPERKAPEFEENNGYLGYAVTSARLEATRKNIWYLAGAPRASRFLGNVNIFSNTGKLTSKLTGKEFGSYFGSAILAVDVNNDRVDDLLVGAPMGAGSTWDEGYVYFYKTYQMKLENPVKLVGGQKAGARFGTSIASLGDIDLDSYNDIAISAPYENDGVGAVYIYMGSKMGLNIMHSQRLSPKDFSVNLGTVKGFGQGLSKGVDIDGNGHNDLAVGAYKSDKVFIIKTTSIIDYKLSLESNLTSVSSISTNFMNVKFCIEYTQRSKTKVLRTVAFYTELLLDDRVKGDTNITDTFHLTIFKSNCKSLDIVLKQSSLDILPFRMVLRTKVQDTNVIAKGDSQKEKTIPYSHGCGSDNKCQTRILLEAFSIEQQIVLGETKEITVDVTAENAEEPGYGCQLLMNFPNALELRNSRDCDFENNTYTCPVSSRLTNEPHLIKLSFDTKLRNPDIDQVVINFEIKCLGENLSPDTSKSKITLDVLVKNSPYIKGSSVPANFDFNDDTIMEDVEISHIFKIGNFGPSPVQLDVFILVPVLKKDGIDVFEIDAKGSLNGIEVRCYPTNKTVDYGEAVNVQSLLTESMNRTIVIDCFEEGRQCLALFCDGGNLYKSTEIAQYNLKIKTKINLLASHYRSELFKDDIIAYISTAYLYSSTGARVADHSTTLIFASRAKPVPLWIYIVGGLTGILLLALLIFLLYKCHFFERNYRDKLNDEQLMDHKKEDNTDDTDKSEDDPNLQI